MSIESFAAVAADFCRWVEASPAEPSRELDSARRMAARLYAAALELPEGSGPSPEPSYEGLPREVVFKRFANLPFNMYAVVDPLTVPATDTAVGDLADDFTDTYFEVLRGLRLHRSGDEGAAISDWAWSFRYHWGDHMASAMAALQAFVTRV